MEETLKLTRRQAREEIIKSLYQMNIHEEYIFDDTEDSFVNESLHGIVQNLPFIDATIESNLQKWRLSRLSFVDRAIMRFATYELLETKTPQEIIINEALNLTRKFSDEGNDKMVGFTNKVLDNIAKSLKRVG